MNVLQKCSFGLMQIMGATAMSLGFRGELPSLLNPYLGVLWGSEYLKHLIESHPHSEEEDWIAAYNAGSVRKTPGGMYENQSYVNRVSGYLKDLRKLT
jgi:soluble lytic murein transglycosylase-like protein